ncbi:rCG49939 [Rattus norvegicus]|uniref:RCG49939 n=1 Tax=Rattus norvegicus TaxID=10116 RepID=A6KUX4_RAT|nr:rCG49939 [Rattus norvegicus]
MSKGCIVCYQIISLNRDGCEASSWFMWDHWHRVTHLAVKHSASMYLASRPLWEGYSQVIM